MEGRPVSSMTSMQRGIMGTSGKIPPSRKIPPTALEFYDHFHCIPKLNGRFFRLRMPVPGEFTISVRRDRRVS